MIATAVIDYKMLKVLESDKPRCGAKIMIQPDPKLDLVYTKHTHIHSPPSAMLVNENPPKRRHRSSSALEKYARAAITTSPSQLIIYQIELD